MDFKLTGHTGFKRLPVSTSPSSGHFWNFQLGSFLLRMKINIFRKKTKHTHS